jgi:cbb3-type cytochrome oxidase maturation protein
VNILYLLIPLSIVLIGFAVWAFFWAVGSGQFDDLESPAWRILMDDDTRPPKGEPTPPAEDADES